MNLVSEVPNDKLDQKNQARNRVVELLLGHKDTDVNILDNSKTSPLGYTLPSYKMDIFKKIVNHKNFDSSVSKISGPDIKQHILDNIGEDKRDLTGDLKVRYVTELESMLDSFNQAEEMESA
ncbi:hypothetical protein [Rickettsiales endosymbiont of Stachyamoeba lipophora]|uniref:hypothetical protein n=1 Tax=Rickettsiales endosymbiont of Stachyamoeba lipophora TaxID=2486578 RepID=UPI000F64C74C|nr:hypothetical protein [Rickettsiales endosymbiont of Stachyamoeba lipophora]AZL15117.1 hypothetical protein EF513_00875 [Rickettsiales endosymbiont of Stachyamoeba lipophora]